MDERGQAGAKTDVKPAQAYDFERVIDRRQGDSMKWARYAGRDVIPLWVADMDFSSPPEVMAALQERVAHGVFGYGEVTEGQQQAVVDYLSRQFGWTIEADWIVWLPGLVTGLHVVCRAVGNEGDAVLTTTPIYPPFMTAPRHAGRRVVKLPLVDTGRRWEWDFEALEVAIVESGAKLLLLCHPHNPTGRVWDDDELQRLAALALKHGLIVCADEIHNGLVLSRDGRKPPPHRPFAMFAASADAGGTSSAAEHVITLMAASKTFNIPGLGAAFAIIPSASLRQCFRAAMAGIVPHVNVLGMVATEAALRHGEAWRQGLIGLLSVNAAEVARVVAQLPGLSMRPVEATCLAWIDAREFCRQRGIDAPARYFEQHGLGLSDGADFGMPGFVRLNFGLPRTLLDEALARLVRAVRSS